MNTSSSSRRRFLRSAGLAAGAVAVAPGLALSTGRARLTAGVLLPDADSVAGAAFLRGLAEASALRVRTASIGASPAAAYREAETLLERNRVDVLVALVSPAVAARLTPLAEAHRTPLIVTGIGADVVLPEEQSAYVFHHTLGGWQGTHALGGWAAGHLGRRAVAVTSVYDTGFDLLPAFRQGFAAQGGRMLDHFIPDGAPGTPDLDATLALLRQNPPDVVYAGFHGDEAVRFLKAYRAAGLQGRIPLVGGPLLTDAAVLAEAGSAAAGVRTALVSTDDADPFTLLGRETAQWFAAASEAQGTLTARLRSASFEGARGTFAVDAETQHVRTDVVLREVQARPGRLVNAPAAALPAPGRIDYTDGFRTGWLDAYACA